jgi:hypothetical protein
MVIAEAWSDNGLDDVRVVGIKNDFYIVESDFDKIETAIKDCIDDQMLDGEWYRFELVPRNEDDGSGAMRLDWYEIIKVECVTEHN